MAMNPQKVHSSKTAMLETALNEVEEDPFLDMPWWKRLLTRARNAVQTPPPTQAQLRRAIRNEDIGQLARWLSQGVELEEGTPWVSLAARRTNGALVSLLLEHGAPAEAFDRQTRGAVGRSPMHEAARRGWIEGMELLHAAGSGVELLDDQGQAPIHIASARGQIGALQWLLEHGANPAGPIGSTNTALHVAKNPDVIDRLLKAGADANKLNARGDTTLHAQARLGRAEMVRALLSAGANPNRSNPRGVVPLAEIGRGDALEVARLLLDAGADPFVRDEDGNTPLHRAVAKIQDEQVFVLFHVRFPALWDEANRAGETMLLRLIGTGHSQLAKRIEADLASAGRQGGFFGAPSPP